MIGTPSHLFDFVSALAYVRAQLTLEEHKALLFVTIKPITTRRHPAVLRGCFIGEQARRSREFEDELEPGTRARGEICIFLREHRPGVLADLAVTIHHEVDHAIGFGETEVLRRAAGRKIVESEVASFKPYWRGHTLIYPRAEVPQAPRKTFRRKFPVLG